MIPNVCHTPQAKQRITPHRLMRPMRKKKQEVSFTVSDTTYYDLRGHIHGFSVMDICLGSLEEEF